jgi:hypothetical protein
MVNGEECSTCEGTGYLPKIKTKNVPKFPSKDTFHYAGKKEALLLSNSEAAKLYFDDLKKDGKEDTTENLDNWLQFDCPVKRKQQIQKEVDKIRESKSKKAWNIPYPGFGVPKGYETANLLEDLKRISSFIMGKIGNDEEAKKMVGYLNEVYNFAVKNVDTLDKASPIVKE